MGNIADQPFLNRISQLIQDFEALKADQRTHKLRRIEDFLATFRQDRRTAWNVFSLLKIRADEVAHSRILAWLLNAESPHGEGPLFLKTFIKSCGLPLGDSDLDRYVVRTEFSGIKSIVDIMICQRGEFIIYIENKVHADEGPGQIDRELRDMRRIGRSLGIPERRQFPVFLTPDGREPMSGNFELWTSVSYTRIADGFRQLLPSLKSSKASMFLDDWIETALSFGGD